MTAFTAEHFATLRGLGLTWGFRLKAIVPGEKTVICDLTNVDTHAVVLSVEGPDEPTSLCKAVEYAERWAEEKTLLAERESLTQQLAEQQTLGATP